MNIQAAVRSEQGSRVGITMQYALETVKELESIGYQVHKVIIGNSGVPVIMLYKTKLCDDAIKAGRAFYQVLGNRCPIRQGFMQFKNCRCVWPESLY